MKPDTLKYRVLDAVAELDEPTNSEVTNHLQEQSNVVSATFSTLHGEDYVERRGEGGRTDPYRYNLTGRGRGVVEEADEDPVEDDRDDAGGTGLAALFDSVDEGENGTNGGVENGEIDAQATEAAAAFKEAREFVEDLNARYEGVHVHLNMSLELGSGGTVSEQRAATEEAVGVVEKEP